MRQRLTKTVAFWIEFETGSGGGFSVARTGNSLKMKIAAFRVGKGPLL